MTAELKPFVQKIIRLASPTTDIGNAVIPSLSGTQTAGTQTIQQLHLRVMEFAQAYKDPSTASVEVQSRAKAVEGSLMTAVTLGAIEGRKGSQLIDELQALLERRGDQPEQVDHSGPAV